jgi:CheY-like chemotaxis protein
LGDEHLDDEANSASAGEAIAQGASAPQRTLARASSPQVERSARRAQESFQLLLVEDNSFVSDLFEYAVRRYESQSVQPAAHAVLMAKTAHEALRILEQVRPDLVILDHYLPGMTGCALLRRLRATDGHEHTPIVVMSTGGEDVRREALAAGATSFISKPLLLTQIVELLRAVEARGDAREQRIDDRENACH